MPHITDPRPSNRLDGGLQRARGQLKLVLSGSGGDHRIVDIYQRWPIRVLLPMNDNNDSQEIVLLNTAGGLAGGDRLAYDVTVCRGASIAITSQAAEKVYRSLGEPAHVTTKLVVQEGARVAWLPQETIVFDRARFRRHTEVDFHSGAEFLGAESLVLGRTASGEQISDGEIVDGWRIKKDGELVWADELRIVDDAFLHLERRALLSNCRAIATMLFLGPDLDRRFQLFRDVAQAVDCHAGVTAVGGVIVARFAAKLSSDLRAALQRFLLLVEPALESGAFRVPKMWRC